MLRQIGALAIAVMVTGASSALAQSAAGFAGEPNAETNQVPAPSNTQPADPGAGSYAEARTPTDPQKRSDREAPGRVDTGSFETYAPEVSDSLR